MPCCCWCKCGRDKVLPGFNLLSSSVQGARAHEREYRIMGNGNNAGMKPDVEAGSAAAAAAATIAEARGQNGPAQSSAQSPEEPSGAAKSAEQDGEACSSTGRVAGLANIAASTMPACIAASAKQSVKMAGYLDKRGKRLPTWKTYWFVLDGRLLLYFRSQLDYLQLSPCRGSLNLGLVSSVRPAGSRHAPQLELVTRSQAVMLRTKERETQERWLQALLDAMQGSDSSSGQQTHFRYNTASLPSTKKKKKTKASSSESLDSEEDEENVPTPRVLKHLREQQGAVGHGTLMNEIRTAGPGSLRNVTPRGGKGVSTTKGPSSAAAELSAQLPTNKAVLRLLERRLQEDQETSEPQHVTTIVIDPAAAESSSENMVTNEEYIPSGVLVGESAPSNPQGATVSVPNTPQGVTASVPATASAPNTSQGDVYLATPARVVEDEEEEDPYEAIPESQAKEDDYETYTTLEGLGAPEPSLPPRREEAPVVAAAAAPAPNPTKENKKEKSVTILLTPEIAPNPTVKRKKSFLQRMLRSNKIKKQKTPTPACDIPTITLETFDDETAGYETVDYEELLRNREIAAQQEEVVAPPHAVTKVDTPPVTSVKSQEKQTPKNLEYVNIDAMMSTPASTSSETQKESTASSIVPIMENEKTHTVTITVQDPAPPASPAAAEVADKPEEARPKLPPRRSSSSGSLQTGSLSTVRPESPCHDVPTNNAPVIAVAKRRSGEQPEKVEEEGGGGADLHKTIINIAGTTSPRSTSLTEIKESDTAASPELRENTLPGTKVSSKPSRCTTLKHRSADELDILLSQLKVINSSPLHAATSVSALCPLRRTRLGSDPDYDIPRPHHLHALIKDEAGSPEESMEATRFFSHEPDLYYARPLSEYLRELDRMSNVQQQRNTRASKAFHKWLEGSPDLIPVSTPEDEEVQHIVDKMHATMMEMIQESGVTDTHSLNPIKDSVPEKVQNLDPIEETPKSVSEEVQNLDPKRESPSSMTGDAQILNRMEGSPKPETGEEQNIELVAESPKSIFKETKNSEPIEESQNSVPEETHNKSNVEETLQEKELEQLAEEILLDLKEEEEDSKQMVEQNTESKDTEPATPEIMENKTDVESVDTVEKVDLDDSADAAREKALKEEEITADIPSNTAESQDSHTSEPRTPESPLPLIEELPKQAELNGTISENDTKTEDFTCQQEVEKAPEQNTTDLDVLDGVSQESEKQDCNQNKTDDQKVEINTQIEDICESNSHDVVRNSCEEIQQSNESPTINNTNQEIETNESEKLEDCTEKNESIGDCTQEISSSPAEELVQLVKQAETNNIQAMLHECIAETLQVEAGEEEMVEELQEPPQAKEEEEEQDEVIMRPKSCALDREVRLSYAKTDTELVLQETVHSIKTPFPSSTFEFAHEQ